MCESGHDQDTGQELAGDPRRLLEPHGRAGFALTLVHVSERPEMEESVARELETTARRLGSGSSEDAEPERIRSEIRAGTEESLESVGGLSQALETILKINARRATDDGPEACGERLRGPRPSCKENPGSDLSERPGCASEGRFRGGRSRPAVRALKGS